ncbi:MAG TPA: hypothetical protein VGR71_16970 [Nitrospira sp.]|nr:hypothetical protein [Nitrospira sp.]
MPIQVDMTGVTVEGPPPLEPGKYPAVITKADIHPSKSSNEPTLYLEFAVGEEGRNLRWNTSLGEKSLWRLKRFLVNIGLDVPDGPFELDEQELVGVECVVDVGVEAHYREADRKQNRVLGVLGPDEAETGDEASWG